MTDKYYYEHQAPEHEWLEWYKQHESNNMNQKIMLAHQQPLI